MRCALLLITLFPIIVLAAENPLAGPAPKGHYFVIHRCIDNGGLKDRQTGKFLECFSMLVPKGWKFQGGLRWIANEKPLNQFTRTDLMKPVRGQWQAVSPDGHSAFTAYPEVCWIDLSRSPERQFGIVRPLGSDYEGMIVCPPVPAEQYITDFVIPRQRGQLAEPKVVSKGAADELAKQYTVEAQAINRALGGAGALSYRAGVVVVEHREKDKVVREVFVCIIEYIETGGVVMWWPKINVSAKAPKDDWAAMEKVFLTMIASVRVNPRWMVEYAIMVDKAAIGIGEVDAYCRKIDQQITANRAKTNLEIHRQMQPQLLPWHDYKGSDGRLYYLDTTKSHSMHENGLIYSGDEYLDHLAGWKRMQPHIAKD